MIQLTELDYYKLKTKLLEITLQELRLVDQKANLLASFGIKPGNVSFNDSEHTVSSLDAKGEVEK